MSYLYLPETLERIRRFNPDARFIALVRNPLAMLPSYHLRMRFLLQEDEPDFGKAWALEPARARGERVPRHCLDPRLLMYSQVAQLGAQIERLFAIAGRDRSHVIVFDDLAADTLGVYRRALEFLHVDYDGQDAFRAEVRKPDVPVPLAAANALRAGDARRQDDRHAAAPRPQVQPGRLETAEPDQARDGLEQGQGLAGAADARRWRPSCARRSPPTS